MCPIVANSGTGHGGAGGRTDDVAPATRIQPEVSPMNEARFTEEHAWVRMDDDGIATVGISDYAQEQLGDIVYVQLPDIGRDLVQSEDCAMIESVKTTSDVKCPIGGRVIEINETLADVPERVNEGALDDGWLFRLEPADDAEFEDLMDGEDYDDFVDSLG